MISFGQIVQSISNNITETAGEFLDRFIKSYVNHDQVTIDKIGETGIVFTLDLKDMTYTHHMEQPKRMIYRKMIRRLFGVKSENINDFE